MRLPVLQRRECGDCGLCCKLPGIPEAKAAWGEFKASQTWCPMWKRGDGCTCYDERPSVCRDFECTWRTIIDWPANLSPLKTGCVGIFEPYGFNTGRGLLSVHEQRPGDWRNVAEPMVAAWNSGHAIAVYTPEVMCRVMYVERGGTMPRMLFEVEAAGGDRSKERAIPYPTIGALVNAGWSAARLKYDMLRMMSEMDESGGCTLVMQ